MIGLIGCGRWGSKILRDLRALGCDVGVVARSDRSVGRAHEGGASAVWSSIDAMAEVDGIVVATPTSTHSDVAASVLDRDVPVFVEKPIGVNAAAVRSLVERGAGRIFVMHKWRYHRGVEHLRDLARSGEFGELRRLHIDFLSMPRRYADADGSWALLPHPLSIVLEIAGRVPAVDSTSGWRSADGDIDIVATLGERDVTCVICVSTVHPIHRREVAAVFDNATIVLADGYAEHLSVHHHDGERGPTTIPFEAAMPLEDELAAFVGHVAGGPAPRSSADEGLQVVETIAGIRGRLGWDDA